MSESHHLHWTSSSFFHSLHVKISGCPPSTQHTWSGSYMGLYRRTQGCAGCRIYCKWDTNQTNSPTRQPDPDDTSNKTHQKSRKQAKAGGKEKLKNTGGSPGKQSDWGQTETEGSTLKYTQTQVKWIRAGLKAQTHDKGESSRESFFFEACAHLSVTVHTNYVFSCTAELQQLSTNESNLANIYTNTSHNKRASVLHDWGAPFATKQSLINM